MIKESLVTKNRYCVIRNLARKNYSGTNAFVTNFYIDFVLVAFDAISTYPSNFYTPSFGQVNPKISRSA